MTARLALLAFLMGGCAHYPINPKLEKYEPPRLTMGAMVNSPIGPTTCSWSCRFPAAEPARPRWAMACWKPSLKLMSPLRPTVPSRLDAPAIIWRRKWIWSPGFQEAASSQPTLPSKGGGFADFKENFLYRNVTWGLIGRLLNPINMIRVASPYFSKSDLEAEYLDDHLFHGATFKDMNPPG